MNAKGEPIVFAALMPHAPVLIPPIGGRRGDAARASVSALEEISRRVVARQPEVVVLISPHSPRRGDAFGVWAGERVSGTFAQFGAPEVGIDLPNDSMWPAEMATEARRQGVNTWEIRGDSLDHGALVPLWHLAHAGWTGPTVVLSLNRSEHDGKTELGRAIAATAAKLGQRIAVIASGDMSHRLKEGAPCGYEPRAQEFDHLFIDTVRRGAYREVMELDMLLQELAAEDVVDSTVIAASSVDWKNAGREVLSYEGPFGVGYGVAVLFDAQANGAAKPQSHDEGKILPRIVRASLQAAWSGASDGPPTLDRPYLQERHGVFVTIRTREGKLRGCVGTIWPKFSDVVTETWHMARESAFRDGRFSAVQARELPELRIEVSVLEPLEEVASEQELDAKRYGVVVSAADGRRGALLPDIEGVETVTEQLEVARRKAGIQPWEPVRLERFTVEKFKDSTEA